VRTNGSESSDSTLWPEPDCQHLKAPERQLLDAIASGALDHHLVAVADAIDARRELLLTVRSANAIAQFCVGETVMFNASIRPRYLRHETAVIIDLDDHWVTVRLWRPVGRFRAREVRCPPLALQTLDRSARVPR
jgi:hypothetical protein